MSGRLQFVPPTVEELQPLFTQFAIHECVAVGGMGAVYRATQSSLDRPVAFKVLPPVLARDAKFRQRFTMEAKAMARLSHPNIVQLYDFGQAGEITWMAQEWIEGKTVEHVLLEEGSLDGDEAAAMVAQACEGLGYAHKQGIVHRDVKPANLMEDHEGTVKVMDFGLARRHRDGGEQLRAEGEGRFATAQYAAPEIWDLDRQPDHRVDIFALGVLLFEALTGERPGEVFRRPSEVKEGLDARFDEIVVRALQRNPERRFQSCAEMTDALREVVTMPAKPITTPLQLGGGGDPDAGGAARGGSRWGVVPERGLALGAR